MRAIVLREGPRDYSSVEKLDEETRRVWTVAFTLMVRRRFAKVPDLREIARYVDSALPRLGLPAGGRTAREAEAIIRWVLGEWDLTDGIDREDLSEIVAVILVDLIRLENHSPAVLDELLIEFELQSLRYRQPFSVKAARPRTGWLGRLWRRRS